MSANMNSFFDELVEAKRAMEKVPELEGQLAYHKSQHTYAESRNDDFRQEIDRKNAQLVEAQAQIAKLEADLAQTTFQGQEVRDRLEVLLSAVRGVVKEVSETVELVSPAPKAPEPEVVASADPTQSSTNETLTSGPSAPTTGEAISPSRPWPWTTAPDTPTVDPTSAGVSEPTEVGPSAERPFSPGTSAEASATSTEVCSNVPTTGPFASSTDGTSPDAASGTQATMATNDAGTSSVASPLNPRPHEGQPYWHKPSSMTWLEWSGLGGQRPQWVADGYYDSVR